MVSEHILSEMADTFSDPYFVERLPVVAIDNALAALRIDATIQPIVISVSGIASHTEDDLIIATALSAQCKDLVTGDKRLGERAVFRGTMLLSPRQFLDVLERESPA